MYCHGYEGNYFSEYEPIYQDTTTTTCMVVPDISEGDEDLFPDWMEIGEA